MYHGSGSRGSGSRASREGVKDPDGQTAIGKDLVAASAVPLVLGILAEGESYGYAISKRVSELSDGRLDWADGMMYPLLHRLERLDYIEAEWRKPQDGGRRRKYYQLTAEGQRALSDQHQQWTAVTEALASVWGGMSKLGEGPVVGWT